MANSVFSENQPKVVVVGIGNTLLKDEGIGVHIANTLQEIAPLDSNLEIIDGGTSPDVFLNLKDIEKLIIVDAAEGSGEPGTLYRYDPESLFNDSSLLTSIHQVGIPQSLKLMDHYGIKPKQIIVYGIQPKDIDWGLEPSDELKQKIPEIVKIILKEVKAG